jgi:hypothetical protein
MGKDTNDKATTRDSMIFYRSFWESIKELDPETQLEVYDAIFQYAFNLNEIQLEGVAKAVFTAIKPQLEANRKRYENGKKGAEHGIQGAEHGSKGGRPKNNETGQKPPKNPPNDNVNDNVNENDNGNGNVNGNGNKGAVLMKNSAVKDLESFKKAFEGTEYEKYDLKHYFDKVLNWSDSKGAKKKDWVATARTFMIRDKEQGREILNPNPPKSNKQRPLPKVKDI